MFLCFDNDIKDAIKYSNFLVFADDSKIFRKHSVNKMSSNLISEDVNWWDSIELNYRIQLQPRKQNLEYRVNCGRFGFTLWSEIQIYWSCSIQSQQRKGTWRILKAYIHKETVFESNASGILEHATSITNPHPQNWSCSKKLLR